MNIQPFGDSAVLVNFENQVTPLTNEKVIALFQGLKSETDWVRYVIPAHCSLTVGFDPMAYEVEEISVRLADIYAHLDLSPELHPQHFQIPVCYDNDYAPDMYEVARALRMTPDKIISMHTSSVYRVYTMGFLPGFGYLGTLDKKLHVKRKAEPRLEVPARSVAIAGEETAVYPCASPGGWQIIGRTPVEMILTDMDPPFLLSVGDLVQFVAIKADHYKEIRNQVLDRTFDRESLYAS